MDFVGVEICITACPGLIRFHESGVQNKFDIVRQVRTSQSSINKSVWWDTQNNALFQQKAQIYDLNL